MVVVAGGLFVLAALLLTVPWRRRDPAGFSPVEVGYAVHGPNGGLLAAVRLLKKKGLVEVRPRRDQIRRKGKRLPKDVDPLGRAVLEALRHHPHSPAGLLDDAGVGEELRAVGGRVQRAGLRLGPARRVCGSVLALAAPVVAVIGVVYDVDPVVGIAVAVVSTVGEVATLRQNGMTLAGRRTLAAAGVRRTKTAALTVQSVGVVGGSAEFADRKYETPGWDFDGLDSGGGGGSD